MKFCLNATYFTFRGEHYQQIFGTAMGSPVSVTVANLVMVDVEEHAIESYDIILPFWKRYVDDVCTIVPKDRVNHMLQHLNSFKESIQFTVDLEKVVVYPFST